MRNPTALFKCYYLCCFYLSIVSTTDKRMELEQFQELFSSKHIINVSRKKKMHYISNEKKKQDVFEKLQRNHTVKVNRLRHFDSLPTCVQWSLITALFLSYVSCQSSIYPSFHIAFLQDENYSKYVFMLQNFTFFEMQRTVMQRE